MRNKQENEELFEVIGRSGQMWLAQARQLKMAADSILPNLIEAFKIPPSLAGAQDKRFAFLHSYMLLIGLSFENLTKGILIERDPTLVAKDRIESGILARGGHGIAEAVRGIISLGSEATTKLLITEHAEQNSVDINSKPIQIERTKISFIQPQAIERSCSARAISIQPRREKHLQNYAIPRSAAIVVVRGRNSHFPTARFLSHRIWPL
jgi:hypothetical protein